MDGDAMVFLLVSNAATDTTAFKLFVLVKLRDCWYRLAEHFHNRDAARNDWYMGMLCNHNHLLAHTCTRNVPTEKRLHKIFLKYLEFCRFATAWVCSFWTNFDAFRIPNKASRSWVKSIDWCWHKCDIRRRKRAIKLEDSFDNFISCSFYTSLHEALVLPQNSSRVWIPDQNDNRGYQRHGCFFVHDDGSNICFFRSFLQSEQ